MTVLVPCLSCRLATAAPEDAAALSCRSCGATLPPPAEAAWFMLREGAQYGPYRIADLAGWIVEGRILAKDSIWYRGAPLRLDVDRLPRFGVAEIEASEAPASVEPEPAPKPAASEPIEPGSAGPEPAPAGPAASGIPPLVETPAPAEPEPAAAPEP